jgi:hypothetical protein
MFRQRLSRDRAAISAGGQLILQPAFATSDRKFNTQEIVSSAAIAADCSGNERAIKRCKMSGYLKRGLHEHQDINVLQMFGWHGNFNSTLCTNRCFSFIA